MRRSGDEATDRSTEEYGAGVENQRDRSVRRTYIGNHIAWLRKERHWSLTDLALRSGISLSHLGRIERGVASPSYSVIASIAEALEVDLARFVIESRGQERLSRFLETTMRSSGMLDEDIAHILSISPEGQEVLVGQLISVIRST